MLGLDLARGATLHDPGPAPSRRLEVLGDSISAGLANENTGLYTNRTENGYLAWGPELARRLGAEWHIEARGGGTFYSDTWLPMPPYFDRMFGPANLENAPAADNPAWSFAAWKPDVFVLALGTNDFSDQYPDIDQTLYTDKYQAFLGELRADYPNAEIFCLAPFKQGTPWDEVRKYIPLAVAATSDTHIHAIDPVGDGTDLWITIPADYVKGDQFHPNIAGHKKIADRMEAIVRPVMGW